MTRRRRRGCLTWLRSWRRCRNWTGAVKRIVWRKSDTRKIDFTNIDIDRQSHNILTELTEKHLHNLISGRKLDLRSSHGNQFRRSRWTRHSVCSRSTHFLGNSVGSNPPPTPAASEVAGAVDRILSGGYMTGLTQYRNIGQGYLLGSQTVTSSDPPSLFTDDDVSNFIRGQISAGAVPDLDEQNQTLYRVFMPVGVSPQSRNFDTEHTYYTDPRAAGGSTLRG